MTHVPIKGLWFTAEQHSTAAPPPPPCITSADHVGERWSGCKYIHQMHASTRMYVGRHVQVMRRRGARSACARVRANQGRETCLAVVGWLGRVGVTGDPRNTDRTRKEARVGLVGRHGIRVFRHSSSVRERRGGSRVRDSHSLPIRSMTGLQNKQGARSDLATILDLSILHHPSIHPAIRPFVDIHPASGSSLAHL
ncbi:hypothetical protein LZ31DRAFT_559068 [Colletotrichum somersetense]|nr:hypothetical protein LZ31DRAFT_559068 [Colletotrichum somersetense]